MSRSHWHRPHYYWACCDDNPGKRKYWKTTFNRRVRQKNKVLPVNFDPRYWNEDDFDRYDIQEGPSEYRRKEERFDIDDGKVFDFYESNIDEYSPFRYYKLFYMK